MGKTRKVSNNGMHRSTKDEYYKLFLPWSTLLLLCGLEFYDRKNLGCTRRFLRWLAVVLLLVVLASTVVCCLSSLRLFSTGEDLPLNAMVMLNCVCGAIQCVMFYKKLNIMRDLSIKGWNLYRSFIVHSYLRNVRFGSIIACILSVMVTFVGPYDMYTHFLSTQDNKNYFINRYMFNHTIPDHTLSATIIVFIFATEINYAWMNCFIIFYCINCCLMKETFKGYITSLKTSSDFSMFLKLHNKITKLVSNFDDAFSSQVFWCSLQCVAKLFVYLFIFTNRGILSIFGIAAIVASASMSLMALILFASFVSESAEMVKAEVHYISSDSPDNMFNQFLIKMNSSVVQLTIWKIVFMSRSTILSLFGAFFTYGILLRS